MGSSGNGKAQAEADKAEAERQRQIKASESAINGIFDSPDRQAQYDALANNSTKFYQGQLDDQNTKAVRNSKFALARSGNIGGSLQADVASQLGKDYERGTVEATRRGNAAAAGLRGSDEQTRQSLIAAAMGGLDATTASQQATSALRSNVQGAQADSTANAFGEMFGDLSNVYNTSLDAKAARQQQVYGFGPLYRGMYGPNYGQPQGGGGY